MHRIMGTHRFQLLGRGQLIGAQKTRAQYSTLLGCVLSMAFNFVLLGSALAQGQYPNRPIRIVVPVPPGPAADAIPRIIADKLSAKWGKPVFIENRPGAALKLGAEVVAKAEPDGYTLLATPPDPLVIAPHFFQKLDYDPAAFAPVTVLVKFPLVLALNPKVPVSTFPELIAYAKANPDKLTFGTSGVGSLPQLMMEDLQQTAGLHFVHVPYQGLGPAMRDLIAGHIDAMFDAVGNTLQYVKEGKLKLLAVTGGKRVAELPDVPTISEMLPKVSHEFWFGVVAPPKTAPEITNKLSQAIAEVLQQPDVRQRLANFVVTPVGSSPAETAAFLRQENGRWQNIIAAGGLKAE